MEYPILTEEVEEWDIGTLVDKCRELHIYEKSMRSEEDFREAIQKYIEEHSDNTDHINGETMIEEIQRSSEEYKSKQGRLKQFYTNIKKLLPEIKKEEQMHRGLQKEFGDIEESVRRRIEQLNRESLSIVVTGEVSVGKSSFINNLIGHDILPARLQHTTAVICRIRHDTYRRIELKSGSDEIVKVIPCQDDDKAKTLIQKYAENRSCRGQEKEYHFVDIYWPLPFLQNTMEIVDTPGIDENKEYEEIVTQYMQKAVAVIFMIDSSNAGGLRERGETKIKEIYDMMKKRGDAIHEEYSRNILFILNKWDSVVEEEKDDIWNENLEKIRKQWPQVGKDHILTLDSRKDKAVRKSRVTGQVLFSRSFQTVIKNVLDLVKKAITSVITDNERWIEKFLLLVEAVQSLYIRQGFKSSKRKQEIRALQERKIESLELMLAEHKKSLHDLIDQICASQTGIVMAKFYDRSFLIENFPSRCHGWSERSEAMQSIDERMPVVIKNLLSNDNDERIMEVKAHLNEILLEILKEFDETIPLDSTGTILTLSPVEDGKQRTGSVKIDVDGTAVLASLLAALALPALPPPIVAAGALVVGAVAGIKTVVKSVKGTFYRLDKEDFIIEYALKSFEKTYLRRVGSKTVLSDYVRRQYLDMEQIIDQIFDEHLRNTLYDNKDHLKCVAKHLCNPNQSSSCHLDKMIQGIMIQFSKFRSECAELLKERLSEDESTDATKSDMLSFQNLMVALNVTEVQRDQGLSSSNILQLTGVQFHTGNSNFRLLTEPYCFTLSEFITKESCFGEVPNTTITSLATGIAKGLQFLHERKWTHGTLTGANVKISANNEPQLTFLKEGAETSSVPEEPVTFLDSFPILPTYCAPEYILGRIVEYTPEADIYSLGVLLWEVKYRKRAFIDNTPLSPRVEMQEFIDYIEDGEGRPYKVFTWFDHSMNRPHQRKQRRSYSQDTDEIDVLIGKCLQKNPSCRISMDTILETLADRKDKL